MFAACLVAVKAVAIGVAPAPFGYPAVAKVAAPFGYPAYPAVAKAIAPVAKVVAPADEYDPNPQYSYSYDIHVSILPF